MPLESEFSLPTRGPGKSSLPPSLCLGSSIPFLLFIRGKDVKTTQVQLSSFMEELISGVQGYLIYQTTSLGSILLLSEQGYSLAADYHSSMGFSTLPRKEDQVTLPALGMTARIVPHCPTGFLAVFAPRDSYVTADRMILTRPDLMTRLVSPDWDPSWVTLPASSIP